MPSSHLKGCGCPQCAGNVKKGLDTFIQQANEVHDHKYDYSEFVYVNNATPGTIICPVHGPWPQIPSSHLNCRGCPRCANESHPGGYNEANRHKWEHLPGVFCILRFKSLDPDEGEHFLKVGITANPRIWADEYEQLYKVTCFLAYKAENLGAAFDRDQDMLKTWKDYRYEPTYRFGGWTECITLPRV